MKKEHKHETLGEKFFDWWDYADFGELVVGLIVSLIVIGFISLIVFMCVKTHESIKALSTLAPDSPMDGVGRVQTEGAEAHLAGEKAYEELTAHRIDTYTEWEGTAPHWYRPWEEMAAEWTDDNAWQSDAQSDAVEYNAHAPVGIDAGGIDWNICTTLWGWDGHGAEAWELDLLARVFYIEFWGTSLPCSEAGCDAILNLWASRNYGRTLFEALSYYDPVYGYTYEVYPWIWDWNYDPDGLEWCKAFCMERFFNGPEWSAVYFQLGGYHDTEWVPPLYELDGVYFSGARG